MWEKIKAFFAWLKANFHNGPVEPVVVVPPPKPTPDNPNPKPSMRLLGIDVSHYEPRLNWSMAHDNGRVMWMYTKATEGISHVDALLDEHIGDAKAAGVIVGAYHFFRCSLDAKAQAEHFLKTVAHMPLDLPHCLDWESSSADGIAPSIQKMKAKIWLDAVEKASGKVPVIYGGESHLRSLALGPEFARYPLWLAHYGVAESSLKIPQPWRWYTMWQFTDAGSVPGLAANHHVDSNYFAGSIEDLKVLCKM